MTVWNSRSAIGMAIALIFALALGACAGPATTAALEPQQKTLSTGKGRIYVIRLDALSLRAQAATVSIDGVKVGALGNESYLSVDRPPGRHKLSTQFPFLDFENEHEFQLAAGQSRYFVLNMKSMTTMASGVMFTIPAPNAGQPVQERNFLSSSYLAEVDQNTGAAMIAKMKQ